MKMNEFRRNSAIALSSCQMAIGFSFALGKGIINIVRNRYVDKYGNVLVDDAKFYKTLMLPTAHLFERARQRLENARCSGAKDLDDFINDLTDFIDKMKEGAI